MSTIAGHGSSPFAGGNKIGKTVEIASNGGFTPQKRRLRSNSSPQDGLNPISLTPAAKPCLKLPRFTDSPSSPAKGIERDSGERFMKLPKSLVKRLSDCFPDKPLWNPRDQEQLSAVKEALHVSTAPSTVVCREDEQKRVLEFCKQCVEQEKAGSLYVCGCPGTGKSMLMEKVKESMIDWTMQEGFQAPDVVAINCTSLSNTSEIFSKILGNNYPRKKTNGPTSPLKCLQNSYSQKQQSPGMKLMLIIADELDYLITKDRAVLQDLFMLTTLPFSRCILIGIANAIDLADRFLPKLLSLNCEPMVVTFRAYSKDQIIMILQRRLRVLPYTVFQPQALELCARECN